MLSSNNTPMMQNSVDQESDFPQPPQYSVEEENTDKESIFDIPITEPEIKPKKKTKHRAYECLENPDGTQMTVPDFLNMVEILKENKRQGTNEPPAIKQFGLINTKWHALAQKEKQEKKTKRYDYMQEINNCRRLLPSFNQDS